MKGHTILIVEDELAIADTLKIYLENEGFDVEIVGDGIEAVKVFHQLNPTLVLLDLNLPGQDGIQVCQTLRSSSNVPIIMITARDEERDKLLGLDIGADDYITKPFSVREVVARIKALLRRLWRPETDQDRLMIDEVVIDRKSLQVWKTGREIQVTPTEFKLLAVLMENAGQVLSRPQIIEAMYGYSYEGFERTLDSHIKNLRHKLEDQPQKPQYILTVIGVGYQFKR
ncbi:winged helix-turn-helix domain-containing protein [Effusibacillus consociatus]|uniref:Winged helix-turn-helix domain-containing protein n=1 Tax=Effusibacillus consociatus TaxID=1117041 RepID=A0ABV9PXY1_9BACL